MDTIRQLPNYVRLLFGLLSDRRVATIDKLLVGARHRVHHRAGRSHSRLDSVSRRGRRRVSARDRAAAPHRERRASRSSLQYWIGDPAELGAMNLRHVLTAAAFFLPRRLGDA